jgi:hypothetical protein
MCGGSDSRKNKDCVGLSSLSKMYSSLNKGSGVLVAAEIFGRLEKSILFAYFHVMSLKKKT